MKNIVSGLYAWLEQTVFTAIVCMLMVFTVASSSGAEMFPIATGGAAQSSSFDGSNYLIGVEDHQTVPPAIAAQMICLGRGQGRFSDPDGTLGNSSQRRL